MFPVYRADNSTSMTVPKENYTVELLGGLIFQSTVELIKRRRAKGRNEQVERERGGCDPIQAKQHPADNGGPGTRYARNQRYRLGHANCQSLARRDLFNIVDNGRTRFLL